MKLIGSLYICFNSFLIWLTAVTQEIMPSTWDKPLRQLMDNCICVHHPANVIDKAQVVSTFTCMVIRKISFALLFLLFYLKEKKQSYFKVKE